MKLLFFACLCFSFSLAACHTYDRPVDTNAAPSSARSSADASASAAAATPSSSAETTSAANPGANPLKFGDISDSATSDQLTIKRMGWGGYAMETFQAAPDNQNQEPGVLTFATCVPRLTDSNVALVSGVHYPLTITNNSQVVLHRDLNYQFGDGSDASSAPEYSLMTCHSPIPSQDVSTVLTSDGTDSVQVKHLTPNNWTMETFDPTPVGIDSSKAEPGVLTIVWCMPRITDKTLPSVGDGRFPIVLTEGSQLVMRRDTNYQFGDGTSAASAKPVVVISCE